MRLAVPPSFVLRDDVYQQTTPEINVTAPGVLTNDILSSCTGGVTLSIIQSATFGNVTLYNDGSFVYTPADPFNLQADQFQYEAICMPSGKNATAWVYLPGGCITQSL